MCAGRCPGGPPKEGETGQASAHGAAAACRKFAGKIRWGAAFRDASPTDPPEGHFRRAPAWRRYSGPATEGSVRATGKVASKECFDRRAYATEGGCRSCLGVRGAVLNGRKAMRGSGLHNPLFDIRYNVREARGPIGARHHGRRARTRGSLQRYPARLREEAAAIQPTVVLPARVCEGALSRRSQDRRPGVSHAPAWPASRGGWVVAARARPRLVSV